MKSTRIAPFEFDKDIARIAARHATPANEYVARVLTWAGDEHVLCSLAMALWLTSRAGNKKTHAFADEAIVSTIFTTIAPHLIKRLINQKRPDRTMVHGRRHGIPKSGKADDAFPSGHAMHAGAIAALVARFYPRYGAIAWMTAFLVSGTRIVVLAHWASDVAAGLGMGWLSEMVLDRILGLRR